MAEERVQRRLAAILASDVVGYSRLTENDEEGTLVRLKQLRRELIEPMIAEHRGRTVKLMGDGALVEFASAADAVRCAVAVQDDMQKRNADTPADQRIEFRIGINLGDIVIDGDDILGDGVNVAARLEGIAEPGGICVSAKVHEEVRGKLGVVFDDLGEQTVKNISKPIRVYRVALDPSVPASEEAEAARPLTERPSIAVLPFDNLSGDQEQEYFADGMAEDIITALSKFRWFFVIARNSSFTYKGRAVDVRTVGRELGVRYVLEGSVRRGGNRLRITAQLVEAATGNHLWAERYDGALEDVFDLQDRITEGVVGAIEPSIRQAEIERVKRKRPESLDAYDLYLQALPHAWVWAPVEAKKAIELLDKALRIDPKYIAAHGLAAWCLNAICPNTVDPDDPRRSKALQHARAVLGPDTDDSLALAFAAVVLAFLERDYDGALDTINRALTYTPNSPIVLTLSARVHAYAGEFDTAIAHAEASLRLSPFDPMRFSAELAAAYGHFFMGRYDFAAEAAQRCVHINPEFWPGFAILIASRASGEQDQAAQVAVGRLLALKPDFRVGEFISVVRFAPDQNEKYAAALRKAGLPE
jgi:TolB-like protein/Tfp pilus assembly protein PilF